MSQKPPGLPQLLFGLSAPVSRRAYLLTGVLLMIVKFAMDAGALYLTTQNVLTPLDFFSPLLTTREDTIKAGPPWLMISMVLWTLPFLWVGASMSVRRAFDAGLSPWIGILFFIPIVNYLAMISLAALPSKPKGAWEIQEAQQEVAGIRSALLGIIAGVVIAGASLGVSVFVFRSYGATLFFATPFVMGATSAYIYNRHQVRPTGKTFGVSLAAIAIASCCFLLFALEGVICIAMAFPIAGGAGALGALLGRAIAIRGGGQGAQVALLVLSLPVLSGAESVTLKPELREVVSAVEIDAPPEKVWRNVVGFTELPPPPQWFFKLGVAYPMHAKIHGEGVGAVRHCVFSTGPFVEPITAWSPPNKLSFNVVKQPASMHEWSPYRHVHAPHLNGYMTSKRGEFRLRALPGGRTRLEGSTWYELDIFPQSYWTIWSDTLISQIHQRVLDHIKTLSEKSG